jgi:benzoate-CoA ligase family protein
VGDDGGWNACAWLLDRHVAADRGGEIALRVEGVSTTYEELHRLVTATAAGLRRSGIEPGERVVLALLDSREFATAFLACLRIGAIAAPVNPLLPWRDIGVIVASAGARLVLVSAARAAGSDELEQAAPQARRIVTGTDEWKALEASDVSAGEPVHPTTAATPGFWLCTSGSTGRPKLAMHRHGDLAVTSETYATEVLAVGSDDRCFSVGPMFHAYGLGNSLSFPMAVGASAVLEPTRPPTPARVAEIVRTEQPTLFFAIPTFYAALNASDIPDDTFASVRLAVSAAEALPAETWHRFHDRFGVEILDGIGSTEMTHIFISNRATTVHPGTSGTVVAGYAARVVDDDGTERPPDVAGHLWVRGPSAASGYYGDEAATAYTFGSADGPDAGWVRTGDTYVRDEKGVYTYLGRSDDMLRVGGEWVAPAEVEATIIEHPSVLEVAVVGRLDAHGVTRPVAYIVARPGAMVEEDDVIEHCRTRLAGYKRPTTVVVMESLPKTATGKIQRYKLRAEG